MKAFLVRGVPASVQTDGWWINKAGSGKRRGLSVRDGQATVGGAARLAALIALLALADQMIWQVVPGVSLAVFGMSLIVVAFGLAGQKGAGGIAIATLFFLPVMEQVQFLSLLFWLAGLALGAGWIGLAKWPGVARFAVAGLRFVLHAPGQVMGDGRGLARMVAGGYDLRRALAGWALPLGVGAVFAVLLLAANPMIESWLEGVFNLGWLSSLQAERAIFWGVMAALIWPFLVLRQMRERLKLPVLRALAPSQPPETGLFNAASVRRSLILFNGVFALQTLMDGAYLWGGAALPEGMSYAQYAHRGAYPLVVMALLAGLFALASRPFVAENRALKWVLLVWIGQTVLLVLSSLYRLELYIEAFGLTRLRLAALLWMGVVAAGLLLVIWQVARAHSSRWLLARVGLLGAAVLYGACFVSFDGRIARYNLTHDVPPDVYYICALGPAALPEIRRYEQKTGTRFCHSDAPRTPQFADWREWGFRDWRVQRSLAKISNQGSAL